MVPALLAESGVVAAHHPLGASTGYMEGSRGDWPAMVAEAVDTSGFAVELAALSEDELPGLEAFLAERPELPFAYVSVHAPVKHLRMPEAELVRRLLRLAPVADAIVVHPDAMDDPRAYRPLGSSLVLENMDARKPVGRGPIRIRRTIRSECGSISESTPASHEVTHTRPKAQSTSKGEAPTRTVRVRPEAGSTRVRESRL